MLIEFGKFFSNIDWSTFWTSVGSVSTSCACIIALWQTKQSTLKKITFDVNWSMVPIADEVINYLSTKIINIGNRKVIIKEWSLSLKNNQKMQLLTNTTEFLPVNLPKEIEPEETLDLYFKLDHFKINVQKLLDEKLLSENEKLKFEIRDSTGKVYSKKTNIKAKNLVDRPEAKNAD